MQGEFPSLVNRLRELEREQQDENVRAVVVKMSMVALIVLAVVGGALFGTAALLPRVIVDTGQVAASKINNWLQNMPPETRRQISEAIARVRSIANQDSSTSPGTNK